MLSGSIYPRVYQDDKLVGIAKGVSIDLDTHLGEVENILLDPEAEFDPERPCEMRFDGGTLSGIWFSHWAWTLVDGKGQKTLTKGIIHFVEFQHKETSRGYDDAL